MRTLALLVLALATPATMQSQAPHAAPPVSRMSTLSVSDDDAITEVQVNAGFLGRDRVAGATRGAKIGAIVLGGIGLASAAFACIGNDGDPCAEALVLYPTLLALGGAFWGAIIGAIVGVRRGDAT